MYLHYLIQTIISFPFGIISQPSIAGALQKYLWNLSGYEFTVLTSYSTPHSQPTGNRSRAGPAWMLPTHACMYTDRQSASFLQLTGVNVKIELCPSLP